MEFIKDIYEAGYFFIAGIVAISVMVFSFLNTIKSGLESVTWLRSQYYEGPEQIDFSKRATMKIIGGVSLLPFLWVCGQKVYTDYKNSKKVISVSKESGLIAHKKTGTIHLAGESDGALPSKKWATRNIDLLRYRPYSGYELRIYEKIGQEAEKQRKDDVIIQAYWLAIKSSPLSYHLYDKLTRVYGRRNEYDKILELHQSALDSLKTMDLNKKRLKRATKEFSFRVERTHKRALLS